jgi:copper(I)-binding protein
MRRIPHGVATIAVLAATSSVVLAQPASSVQIENAWARRAPGMADSQGGHGGGSATAHGGGGNGAVYVTITNRGTIPDALVSATTDAATTVELHETVAEGGVMKMRHRTKLEIPMGGRLEMKPGGYHIMLLGLKHDLKVGDAVRLTLTFDKAGPIAVDASVR